LDLFDHILGGLLGQALGDAWAMPAYFRPDQTWQAYGWITTFLPGPADHPVHHGFAAGRFTDDTEQAFALAESIIAEGRVTVKGAADAIVRWYDRIGGDTAPFVGPSTRRGVQALKKGQDPNTTGLWGDTNGSAMRVSVVGLIHPGDLEGAIQDACLSAIPTHNTDVGFSGAAAVAGAVAVALGGATLDEIIAAGRWAADQGRERGRPWLGPSVSRRIQMAVDIARGPGDERQRLQEIYDVVGCSLSIPESVGAAFGVLAMAEGDPRQAAIYAAALSGDADTVGAMACTIAGAWKGASAIPPDIADTLRRVNPEYDFDKTARALYELGDRRSSHHG
jgi:ADP-ribosylglycohydrolase